MSTDATTNGTDAADTITFLATSTTVNAGEGVNTITATSGDNEINSGTDADTITVTSGDNTINAGGGANTIVATSGINVINTGSGADTITTGGLADGGNTIDAGDGANTITTGAGHDTITGGSDVDTITTGAGNDVVYGGNGVNTITTGAGNDIVYSGIDIDTITTGAGNDEINIKGGTDTIAAGAGNDTLIANFSSATGAVSINGLAGTVAAGYAGNISGLGIATFAGVENFEITSGGFDDTITTGDGTDVVHAGAGSDTVNLAGGNDEAIYTIAANYGATDVHQGGDGVDTLTLEFTAAEWLSAAVQADIADYLAFQALHTSTTTGEADSAVFQFTAFDLAASQFEALNVIVDGDALDPTDEAFADVADLNEDDTATQFASVLVNDDAAELAYSVSLISRPSEGVLTFNAGPLGSPDGSYSFDPNDDFEDLAEGETRDVSFVYEVQDAYRGQTQATVTITVTGTNDAPTLAATTAAATEDGAAITVDLAALGADVDSNNDGETLTYTVSGAPDEGAATISGTTLTFSTGTAFQDLALNQTRDVIVEVTATDAHYATVVNTVTITITGSNDGPLIDVASTSGAVVEATDGSIGEDRAFHSTASTYVFTDVDSIDTHTVSVAPASPGYRGTMEATVSDESTNDGIGTISWSFDVADSDLNDLAKNQTIFQNYTVTVSDGHGGTVDHAVTVSLTGANDAPIAVIDAAQVSSDGFVSFDVLGNDFDNDAGDTFVLTGVEGALLGSASLNGESINYHAGSQGGIDYLTYEITDQWGAISTATAMVIVGSTGFAATIGTAGNDILAPGDDDNLIIAGRGDDDVDAGGGDDLIVWTPGDGNDTIQGGLGFDEVSVVLSKEQRANVVVSADSAGNVFVTGDDFQLILDGVEELTLVGGAFGSTIVTGDLSGTDIANSTVTFVGDKGNGDTSDDVFDGTLVNRRVELYGHAGNDNLIGGAYSDYIGGGAGNDTLSGGAGSDTVDGGAGNDTVIGGDGDDFLFGGEDAGADHLTGGNGNDIIEGGNGSDTIEGGYGADSLVGGWDSSADSLSGGTGNDTLSGGYGADTLAGGAGDDTYRLDDNAATILEYAGGGRDIVISYVHSYTLAGGVENLRLAAGFGAIIGTGHGGANYISGNQNNNTLYGGAGTDTIEGGGGNDLIYGEAGGTDINLLSYAEYLYGNEGNDTLYGGSGHDVLYGGTGDDILDGGTEQDLFYGGDGNDTYYIDHGGEKVTDTSGIDIIISSVGYSLADNALYGWVENLSMTGWGNGYGNRLDNIITSNEFAHGLHGGYGNDTINGNGGNDDLYGEDGTDSISGGDGNDFIDGGYGNDYLNGGNDNDTLNGGTGDDYMFGGWDWEGRDHLIGGLGNDTLDGHGGYDTLVGGEGNDTYYVSDIRATVTEAATPNSGYDTVISDIAYYTLAANVERLYLAEGAGHLNGTGNVAGQNISGNSQNNVLLGADGTGAGGNDVLNGGGGNDYLDAYGTGSSTLNGGDGNDQLWGTWGGGTDHMIGGNGNDSLHAGGWDPDDQYNNFFGNAPWEDHMTGGAGADVFFIGATSTLIGGSPASKIYIHDFTHGVDKLDAINGFYTNLGFFGNGSKVYHPFGALDSYTSGIFNSIWYNGNDVHLRDNSRNVEIILEDAGYVAWSDFILG